MADRYFLAPSAVKLRDQVNDLFPQRDKRSDGWIGDPSHQARPSDHNPLWSAPGEWAGVVQAVDIDVDDNDPSRDLRKMVIDACYGDYRVDYIISNGVIYNHRSYGQKPYTGANAHFSHVHVSLIEYVSAWADTSPWSLTKEAPKEWFEMASQEDLEKAIVNVLLRTPLVPGPDGVKRSVVGALTRGLVEHVTLDNRIKGEGGKLMDELTDDDNLE